MARPIRMVTTPPTRISQYVLAARLCATPSTRLCSARKTTVNPATNRPAAPITRLRTRTRCRVSPEPTASAPVSPTRYDR